MKVGSLHGYESHDAARKCIETLYKCGVAVGNTYEVTNNRGATAPSDERWMYVVLPRGALKLVGYYNTP